MRFQFYVFIEAANANFGAVVYFFAEDVQAFRMFEDLDSFVLRSRHFLWSVRFNYR